MKKMRFGILGSGFLADIVAGAWAGGLLEEYKLLGIVGRNGETAGALAEKTGTRAFRSLDGLLAEKPDYVVEAASVSAVRDGAEKVLAHGADLIVLSAGAFADAGFYERVRNTAAAHGTRVHIASGAIGGFDVLRTVSLMGKVASGIHTRKGPASLRNTPLFEEHLMTDSRETEVFSGNAKEAIARLPTKVNVAVAAAMATAGPEDTGVSITSVPGFTGDDHRITAEADGVKAVVDVYSSTSAIAGWSVVSLLKNLASPVMF